MNSLRVSIPDGSMDKLHHRAREQDKDLEFAASLALIAGLDAIPAHGRFAVLDQATLQALEAILQGGSVTNGADLLAKVKRLAGISMGHIRLGFTPGQLETLKEKADRQGKTVEQLIDQMAPRIYEQFFGLIDQRA